MNRKIRKQLSVVVALILVAMFVLTACQEDSGTNGGGTTNPLEAMDAALENFPQLIDTGATHVPGSTLYYGIAASSPWPGMIGGSVFHDAELDFLIATPMGTDSSLLSMNEFYQFGQDGVATFEYDLDALTFTLTMQHDVYWHDGTLLTLDDLVYAYEIIAHPDYTGPRYSAEVAAVKGIADFGDGLTDSIAGLVLSNNNKTLTMHFDEMGPGMLYFGIWTSPVPRHIYEGIPVADMAASEWTRMTPVGWGPFMVEHVVPGESVSMVRNPNYWLGEPNVERILITRVDPSLVAEHMHNGTFDMIGFPTAEYGDHQNPENFSYIGTPVGDYTYIAFRLGHWDEDNGVNTYTASRKMAQAGPKFRQAMAYAIDAGFIGETVFNGLQFAATTNVTPNHRALIAPDITGFPYDPDRAKELLDEAGFNEFDDEGYRLDRDGNSFTVMWAYPENPLTEGIIVPFFIESWAEVGIRVELWRGQTHPAVVLWDYIDFDDDDDEIDIYTGGWIVGANPNPEGTWGHIWWNPSRYTSAEYDSILDRMNTIDAFDPDVMQGIFSDWQHYWYGNVPYYPTLWQISLTAINNRVTYWDTRHWNSGTNPNDSWHQVGLSAAEPHGR
ncbi:MAG: ABC transporter substrate-binding protein [Oscillospiraceae bacterium]|nr:ABC transporter substrate-binding protein [Oscillospiraceae bacterium]